MLVWILCVLKSISFILIKFVASQMSSKKPVTLNEQIRNTNKVIKEGLRNCARHHVDSFDYTMI